MGDVRFEKVELGYVVDPESDTKEVFIPSPPTNAIVKINPRPVLILFSEETIDEGYARAEELKEYARSQKLFIMCPADLNSVESVYQYLAKNVKDLNIKINEIQIKYMGDLADAAQEAVDYLVDELDVDVEDAEEFGF